MKIRVHMKTPDALEHVADAASDWGLQNAKSKGLSGEDADLLADDAVEHAKAVAEKWFEYGEAVTLEIDTEAETCTVLEAN